MSDTETQKLPPAYLSRRAAAEYLGLSLSTLNRLAVDGGGPVMVQLSEGRLAYAVADLLAWAASRPRLRSTSDRAKVAA